MALSLFPFDGGGRFGGDVVDTTVDTLDFVDDSVGDFLEDFVGEFEPVGSHKV
jgi:hypothetical protein